MHLFRETLLLFSLNLLDALLTIVWVRNGIASEGNQLLAPLLETGDYTFLAAKLAVGTVAAIVLLRWSDLPIAKYGLTAALVVYVGLMGVHIFTGLAAFGYVPHATIESLSHLSSRLFAVLI